MAKENYTEVIKQYKEKPTLVNEISSVEEATQLDEALDASIKALGQESILDVLNRVKNDIKDWQTDIHDNEYDAESHDFVFERIYEIIDEYKNKKDKEN